MKPIFCYAFFILLASMRANAQSDEQAPIGSAGNWLPEMAATVTTGCEQTLLHAAMERYRQLHGLRRTQLPKDLQQKLRNDLAPQLTVCACLTDKISTRWDFAYFMDKQAALAPEIQKYVGSGQCAPAAAPLE